MPCTIASACHAELLVRKSRFAACVQPVDGRADALHAVAALRAAHPGAAHVCWAMLAGGDSAAVDDGEPGGTAGRPMLHVLRQQELDGVLATVVRWFGGVKLGAGGLVRAYTEAVAQALLQADRVALVHWHALACVLPYALEGGARRALHEAGARSLAVEHGPLVRMHFEVAAPAEAALRQRLAHLGQGRIGWL